MRKSLGGHCVRVGLDHVWPAVDWLFDLLMMVVLGGGGAVDDVE